MAITDALVLPDDVILQPVAELPPALREQLSWEEGDVAVSRPRARTPSKIVDADSASLLQQFRTPVTIIDAVISFSSERGIDPEQTLEEAFPVLQRMLLAGLLVEATSSDAERISATWEPGDGVGEWVFTRSIHVLDDTELYQAARADGRQAALKLARAGSGARVRPLLVREAEVLSRLDGQGAPRLIETGEHAGQPYLAIEWIEGEQLLAAAASARHRAAGEGDARTALLSLATALVAAYAALHERGVMHADIHPGNVLVDAGGGVTLIDFGLARVVAADAGLSTAPPRGGVGFFYEPEYARALMAGHRPPPATPLGEQYAVAALVYLLLTGAHYLDFTVEQPEVLRQIAEQPPLPFVARGLTAWPEVEAILSRALSKEPAERFPSTAAFAAELARAAAPKPATPSTRAPVRIPTLDALLEATLAQVRPDGPLYAAGLPAPRASLNFGAAGIAWMLYRIACLRGDADLLGQADLWAARAAAGIGRDDAFSAPEMEVTEATVGRISLSHTASGVHAVRAHIAHAMDDAAGRQSAVAAFLAASQAPCDILDLTLGRASSVLGSALLLDMLSGEERDAPLGQALVEHGNRLLAGIWDELATFGPIARCPELTNLGIAHGWAGLLYTSMRWHLAAAAPLPPALDERLDQLAELARPAGRGQRWPWMLVPDDAQTPYMPGWCNGSAGYVFLWTLAQRVTGDPRWLPLAEGAAWDACESPDAIGHLCCGGAGRAYALLNLARHTGDTAWLARARDLGERAAYLIQAPNPRIPPAERPPHSLYKGAVGVAVLAADLRDPDHAAMPMFEAEGWPTARG